MTNEKPEKAPEQSKNELADISENATANIRFSKRLKLQKDLLTHLLRDVYTTITANTKIDKETN
jgi:hypothetical protein